MHRHFFSVTLLTLLLFCASPALAGMGELSAFRIVSADTDSIGAGTSNAPDGKKDAVFKARISGNGVVQHFSLRNVTTQQLWSTDPIYKAPLLQVRDTNGKVLNSNGGMSALAFVGSRDITLSINDRAALLAKGGEIHLIAHFVDKSTSTAVLQLKAGSATSNNSNNKEAPLLQAALLGVGSRDIVGHSPTTFSPGGEKDWLIVTQIRHKGTLTQLRLVNISGDLGVWDTSNDQKSPFIGVTSTDGALKNRPDGTLSLPLSAPTTLLLWVENNGSLGKLATRSKLFATFQDGTRLQAAVAPIPAKFLSPAKATEAKYLGAGFYDFVGNSKQPRGNGIPDHQFEILIQGSSALTGVRLRDSKDSAKAWDTIPESGNPLVGVSAEDYVLLNKEDGSVSFPITGQKKLYLWVEPKGKMSPASYKLSLLFSDGRTQEMEFSAK